MTILEIAAAWAKDWYTLNPVFRTEKRLALQIQLAIQEAQAKINENKPH